MPNSTFEVAPDQLAKRGSSADAAKRQRVAAAEDVIILDPQRRVSIASSLLASFHSKPPPTSIAPNALTLATLVSTPRRACDSCAQLADLRMDGHAQAPASGVAAL